MTDSNSLRGTFLDRFSGADGLPVIRFAPDYGAEVPLWPSSDETDALVSLQLLNRLKEWQEEFEEGYQFETGWRTEEAKAQWVAKATVLTSQLEEELSGKATLDVDLWPLKSK